MKTKHRQFADIYFDGLDVEPLRIGGKLSPKILLVKPEARLSWQYHHRRAETWRVIEGPVGIVRSATDEEGELVSFGAGETVVLQQGERHRLIGLEIGVWLLSFGSTLIRTIRRMRMISFVFRTITLGSNYNLLSTRFARENALEVIDYSVLEVEMDSPLKASCATARRIVGYWSRSRTSRRSMPYSFLAWIGLARGS
jgi:mannose-6-phosphate isomerase-like protein (cupin superfamily)